LKLLEYEGKSIFREYGIPVPQGFYFQDPQEGLEYIKTLEGRGILKSQVLTGGRGKAGGIKPVTSDSIIEVSQQLLKLTIKEERSYGLLLEELLQIDRELYIGFLIDTTKGLPLFVGSPHGGTEVEEILSSPDALVSRCYLDPVEPFHLFRAMELAEEMGLSGKEMIEAAAVIYRLYQIFIERDCELVEINPLVVTQSGRVMAGDCKMVINDDALYRQKDRFHWAPREENSSEPLLEREARENHINFVDFQGNIAVLSIGAGLTMTILDMIEHIGAKPANFIDTKGGVNTPTVEKMAELVLRKIESDQNITALVIQITLSATQLANLVHGISTMIQKRGCRVPILATIHAADAALNEMDMDEAVRTFNDLGIRVFPQIEDMFMFLKESEMNNIGYSNQ
jgi:succinyl-CoA synthetase beta subunit